MGFVRTPGVSLSNKVFEDPDRIWEMPTVRRLAAILAADMAGYSRLMEADEEGTHQRLRAHFAELIHPKIAEHRGRVVKNTGDGLLAEFASVIEAVRCAIVVQREMGEATGSFRQMTASSFASASILAM